MSVGSNLKASSLSHLCSSQKELRFIPENREEKRRSRYRNNNRGGKESRRRAPSGDGSETDGDDGDDTFFANLGSGRDGSQLDARQLRGGKMLLS